MNFRLLAALGGMVIVLLSGCQRRAESRYTLSDETRQLAPELQEEIQQTLRAYCGTPSRPKLLGDDQPSTEHLRRGAAVYEQQCAACHGTSGDGNGPAAAQLNPRPRDFRRGIFKFTSTPYGAKPRRDDLVRTIREGVVGTAMPTFALLPDDDLQAVTDYVLALTHRGELEIQLNVEADAEDRLDPDVVADLVEAVLRPWRQAADEVVEPVTPRPAVTMASIEAGRKQFLNEQHGCFKCHGADGRGGSIAGADVGRDVWGQVAAAADLTSGMLHGGQRPLDVYRRIYSGINGTPMPAFKNVFADDPNEIWHLVDFVFYLADQRRRETQKQFRAEEGTPTAGVGEAQMATRLARDAEIAAPN